MCCKKHNPPSVFTDPKHAGLVIDLAPVELTYWVSSILLHL